MELSFAARNVLLGSTLLGAVAGTLGVFALLRRQSLLGDALAHAALPGVCLAFLVTGSKSPGALLAGALVSGLAGALAVLGIVRFSRVKEDAAIGIVLSVFFGLGIVLLTHIQKLPGGNQSGLDKFLFGQAAALVPRDLAVMALLGGTSVLLVLVFYKELKLLTFDRAFGAGIGLPTALLEVLLTALLVATVVVGLQTVGVVLMIATLVTPAAAARQWTDRFGAMMALSAALGALSAAGGALASAWIPRLPTGPAIVVLASAALVVSLVFAPRRGLLGAWLAVRTLERRIRRENALKDLWRIGEQEGEPGRPVALSELMGERGRSAEQAARDLARLAASGLVRRQGDLIQLSDEGRGEAARVVRKHRLWEAYLAHQLQLPPDHVHRDAEAMEHALDDEALERIDERLGHPLTDPHGRPIPPAAVAEGAR